MSWITKKQTTVSLSSTEAELVALCGAACHNQWIMRILTDLGFHVNHPVVFHEDNQSTIKIITNQKDSVRMKHVDVKYFFVRDLVEKGTIKLEYVPTVEQEANILTKGLPAPAFTRLRTSLGLSDSKV